LPRRQSVLIIDGAHLIFWQVTLAPPSSTPTSDHHAATTDTCTTASSWAVASLDQRWPTTSTCPTAPTSSYANRAIAWGGTSIPPRADDDPPPHRASSEYGRPESSRTGLTALPDAIMDELGPARVQLRWKLINVDGRRDENDNNGIIGGYAATFEAQDNDGTLVRRTVCARNLVMTIPAHAVGTALNGVLPGSAALLATADSGGGVPYPPRGVVRPCVSQIVLPRRRSTRWIWQPSRPTAHWPRCLAQASSPDGYNLLSRTTSLPPWTGIPGR